MKKMLKTAMAAAIVLGATASMAAPTTAAKCQAGKNKAAGAYYACREKAEAAAISKGLTPDYSNCTAKFATKWDGAETAGAGMCPDNFVIATDMDAFISAQATEAAAIVAGTKAIPECGDGAINAPGEHCDGLALDDHTCATFGSYGTLACTPDCEFDLGGCTACPSPGIRFAEACWVLGAVEADCDAACDTLGLVYDDATSTVAGSAGTDANCAGLLYLTGAPGGELDSAGGDCVVGGLGCAVITEFAYRARCGTPATDSSSSDTGVQRVCACH